MAADAKVFLEEWHRIVAERNVDALTQLLSPEVSLGAPPYWTKLEGADLVKHLLGLILQTIQGFRYDREWWDGAELALEFRGTVEGLEVQGIDLITLDERNRIINLDVLMRPVNTVIALRDVIAPQMAQFLSQRSS